jgi:flagellar hook-associated protein FlgK
MSFGGLNISVSGMLAAQVGLDITGNNIANANTEGYSRKTVSFVEAKSGEMGSNGKIRSLSGVVVDQITRIRNSFLDQQVRQQSSAFGRDSIKADLNIMMNDILGEPSDSGLTAKINDFFKSASDLATNPELETAKTVFVNSASALTDAFKQIDQSISVLTQNLTEKPTGQLPSTVSELNNTLGQLSSVYRQVLLTDARGGEVSEIKDQLDLLLDKVTNLLDVNIVRTNNGEMSRITMDVNSSEALVQGSLNFPNFDSPIAAITSTANTLTLSVNNGSGVAVGPFTVNLETGSTMRDVVEKINKTFKAAGGNGSIASISSSGSLLLQSSTMSNSANNASAAVTIGAGSTALTALGLTAGTTNGTNPTTVTLIDKDGLHFRFDTLSGNNNVGINPTKLVLKTNDGLETTIGSVDKPSGRVGGYLEMINQDIPEMQKSLSDFAMSIKKEVNNLLQLGITSGGQAGATLFTGTHAGNMGINSNVISNLSLLAQGKSGAASDGTIASEISNLFFGTNSIIGDNARSQKIHIDSLSSSPVASSMPLIPGQSITIHADGLINDGGSIVNAGTNGFGGGSLVQIEFVDASGAVIGSAIDFPSSAGAPESRVSFTGAVPAGAAFVRVKMNETDFNDNDISNNFGHFSVSLVQGSEDDSANNINNKVANIIGDFGTRGSIAISRANNSGALFQSLDDRRQSLSGVSIEEEAANLIKFQSSFAANARVINIWNDVFESILGMVR